MNKLGGRKAVGTIVVIAVGCAIELLTKNGLSANMLTLLLTALGLYVAGNVGEYTATRPLQTSTDSKVLVANIQEQNQAILRVMEQSEAALAQGEVLAEASKALIQEQSKITRIVDMLQKRV